jgi:hypothetical protein
VLRICARSSAPTSATASTACSTSPTKKPVTLSSTSSGMDPRRYATTGVPHAIASMTL